MSTLSSVNSTSHVLSAPVCRKLRATTSVRDIVVAQQAINFSLHAHDRANELAAKAYLIGASASIIAAAKAAKIVATESDAIARAAIDRL